MDIPSLAAQVTDVDTTFPIAGGNFLPGTGPIVASTSTASGREPRVLGKPSEDAFHAIRRSFPQVDPGRTLVVGDRAESDILLGRRCGLMTLMVGTGIDTLEDARRLRIEPDFWAEGLGTLWDRVRAMEEK